MPWFKRNNQSAGQDDSYLTAIPVEGPHCSKSPTGEHDYQDETNTLPNTGEEFTSRRCGHCMMYE